MSKRQVFFIMMFSLVLASCLFDEEQKKEKSVYAKYSIWGEEGKEFVTVFLQFSEGPESIASALKPPAKVFLDNYLLTPDSAKESGGFYELQVPLKEFAGSHTIRFVDENNREFSENFSFTPFRVLNQFDEEVSRDEMIVRVEGLKEKEVLRVVMTDTSFEGEGLNELDTVVNSQLDLRKFLPSVVNGPLVLHLFKEEDRSLNAAQNGKISITYGIKKEFELKD